MYALKNTKPLYQPALFLTLCHVLGLAFRIKLDAADAGKAQEHDRSIGRSPQYSESRKSRRTPDLEWTPARSLSSLESWLGS